MSALSEALDHSQSKALAALFKAYTRRDDEPDDDLFRAMMHGVGLDDDVQISFLLHAWRVMRDYPDALPTELADTPADYLEWAADNHPDPIGRAASQEELQRRAEGVPF